MAYKSRKARKAGGKAEGPEFQYNAQGSPEEKEEHAKPDGFKRGGMAKKRAHGGHVEGEKARHHMGKRARGGAMEEKEEHRARGGHIGRRTHGGAMKMAARLTRRRTA